MRRNTFDVGTLPFADGLQHFGLLPDDWYDQDADNGNRQHKHLYNSLTGERLHVTDGRPKQCVDCPFYQNCNFSKE